MGFISLVVTVLLQFEKNVDWVFAENDQVQAPVIQKKFYRYKREILSKIEKEVKSMRNHFHIHSCC